MNILPKKSWHVRTRKNIEKVRRDEAEAERLARLEQDRTLQIEQEVRIRELRSRSNPSEAITATSEHINLFEAPEDNKQSTNKDHDNERRQEEVKSEQRAGIFNRLVRSEDANKPWYCQPKSDCADLGSKFISDSSGDKKRLRSNLITSIYDPMTTMRHAEEVIKARRAERQTQERLTDAGHQQFVNRKYYHDRLKFQRPSNRESELPELDVAQAIDDGMNKVEEHSDSSPEVVKIIEKVKDLVKSDRKRKHSKKKSKKHKGNSTESRHRKHRHKKHRR